MSATDELRRLLDERGIEYAESQDRFRIRFRFNYCEACGDYLNEIEVMGACITASKSYLTPEQAIAATLGGGECEVECFDDGVDEGMDGEWFSYAPPTWYLSCGHEVRGIERPNYCVVCGKWVKR